MKKIIKICFCGLLALGIVGCKGYSMPKYKPGESKQAIATSETDTKMFLSQKVQDVLSNVAGVSSQLLIYQENSIVPTASTKEGLIQSLDEAIKNIDKNVTYLTSFRPASVYESKRNNIVKLMNNFKGNLKEIHKAVEKDDFKLLKALYRNYETLLSQLQTISQ